MDTGSITNVVGVATENVRDLWGAMGAVEMDYTVSVSDDNVLWRSIDDNTVFNTVKHLDRGSGIVRNDFMTIAVARYVRINIVRWYPNDFVGLTAGVYVC